MSKNIFFIIAFLLFSYISSGQGISYQQLIGKWSATGDTSQEQLSISFIDSVNMTMYTGKNETGKYKYTLDTLAGISLLHFEPTKQLKQRADLYWLLKMPDSNTLKGQGADGFGKKPKKWNSNETSDNTAIFTRKN